MRYAQPRARVADEVAGREVVGAVEHEVVVGDHVERGGLVEPLDVLNDPGVRADGVHRLGRRRGLGPADVGDAVHDLALQVGGVDDVVVDDPDGADPGGRQVEQCGRPQAAGSDDEHARGAQPALAVAAEIGQEQVAGVAGAFPRGELRARRHQRGSCHGATLTTGVWRVPGAGVTRP